MSSSDLRVILHTPSSWHVSKPLLYDIPRHCVVSAADPSRLDVKLLIIHLKKKLFPTMPFSHQRRCLMKVQDRSFCLMVNYGGEWVGTIKSSLELSCWTIQLEFSTSYAQFAYAGSFYTQTSED